MVRQWQEFFYDKRYSATPMQSPDFVKLVEAHGLTGLRVTSRAEVEPALQAARAAKGTVVIDFRVEKEDSGLSDGAHRGKSERNDSPAKAAICPDRNGRRCFVASKII